MIIKRVLEYVMMMKSLNRKVLISVPKNIDYSNFDQSEIISRIGGHVDLRFYDEVEAEVEGDFFASRDLVERISIRFDSSKKPILRVKLKKFNNETLPIVINRLSDQLSKDLLNCIPLHLRSYFISISSSKSFIEKVIIAKELTESPEEVNSLQVKFISKMKELYDIIISDQKEKSVDDILKAL